MIDDLTQNKCWENECFSRHIPAAVIWECPDGHGVRIRYCDSHIEGALARAIISTEMEGGMLCAKCGAQSRPSQLR